MEKIVRILISIVVSAVSMFGLAGLYSQILAKDFITENINSEFLRNPPDLAVTFLGYLFLALLMAYAYRYFQVRFHTPVKSGLILGLSTAVVWIMPYSIVLFSVYNFPYIALPMDFFWVLLEQGIGGILIGAIQGRQ